MEKLSILDGTIGTIAAPECPGDSGQVSESVWYWFPHL